MSIRGYCPGVFDLFHIGHLKVIERAREHCDVLVVGVVTDEVTMEAKNRPPVVPFNERFEIVSALRMVDEVVADTQRDKFLMWPEIKYDVLFKGDDWKGTAKGNQLESDLEVVGARVQYFPYTTTTSSTMLREFLLSAT